MPGTATQIIFGDNLAVTDQGSGVIRVDAPGAPMQGPKGDQGNTGATGPQGPIGGASLAIASTIAGLPASPPDGTMAMLRLPGSSDFKILFYDANLGDWVSETQNWTSGSSDATSNAAAQAWAQQLQRNGTASGTHMHGPILLWRDWDTAGLKPQFRFFYYIFNDLAPTNGTTMIRRWATTYNLGDTVMSDGYPRDATVCALDGGVATNYTPGAGLIKTYGDTTPNSWRDLSAASLADVRDFIIPTLGLFSNVSPSVSNGRVYDLTILWRWISK